MATDASPKFQQAELIPLPPQPDYSPGVAAVEHDGLRFWQFMIAGSVAGMVEHMAMFPVDTIKTQMQALGSCPIRSASIGQAVQSILKADGARGLYRGIGAMALGAGPAHAAYFSVYEICKKSFSGGDPDNHAAHAAAGVCATVASDAVLTPMDMVKQRLQLGSSPYKGVLDCVARVMRQDGFGAFYASYRTTVLMNAPFTALHFAAYEAAKRGLTEVSHSPESLSDETLVVHATAGAAAGAIAAALTTPLDVVKTQLQCQGVCGCDRFASGSIGDVFRTIIKKDGYRGLMRGWMPRMLFHAPAAAICWSTYEAAKSFFQDSNNGNNINNVT
ncbi:mitoferrin-like [Salvia divinorum]|uniref:Mitoferrin-like n=1 Tax=Salvia divinorum TaxID=28513 RepID=A0ABD1H914_SALDI